MSFLLPWSEGFFFLPGPSPIQLHAGPMPRSFDSELPKILALWSCIMLHPRISTAPTNLWFAGPKFEMVYAVIRCLLPFSFGSVLLRVTVPRCSKSPFVWVLICSWLCLLLGCSTFLCFLGASGGSGIRQRGEIMDAQSLLAAQYQHTSCVSPQPYYEGANQPKGTVPRLKYPSTKIEAHQNISSLSKS